jgi:hypothetical protein
MSDSINVTPQQLQQLLSRFARTLETRGDSVTDAEIEKLAARFVNEVSPSCTITENTPNRMLNSNVAIKIG